MTQEVRIPQDKLLNLQASITKTIESEIRSLQSIQSLIGSLNFVTRAVSPGRPFLRRLIDLTKGTKAASDMIKIGNGAKKDLSMWLQFLQDFNGISMFLDKDFCSNVDLQLFTDAAGRIGYGAYF